MNTNKTSPFAPNINATGRRIRAAGAFLCGVAAALLWSQVPALAIGLALAALFLAYEATRGWCALRACGVKTKF